MITADTIIAELNKWVQEGIPIPPTMWLDKCSFLNVLKEDEIKKLFDLQQKVALRKIALIDAGDSVAKAKARTDASDEYKAYKIQEAKIEMIEEQIRISKIQSRMNNEQIKNY